MSQKSIFICDRCASEYEPALGDRDFKFTQLTHESFIFTMIAIGSVEIHDDAKKCDHIAKYYDRKTSADVIRINGL